MLKHILDAHGGTLPPDVRVAFMNTGGECEESLQFVAQCGELWQVPITWLEFDPEAPDRTRRTSFATASRANEPFTALIRARAFLPNPLMRFCTTELKIRPCKVFMLAEGFEHWTTVIGYRADEPRRVAKMRAANAAGKERWDQVAPLADGGVTKKDVVAWWAVQPFDLRLPSVSGRTPAGNCKLCFLKARSTIMELMREHPEWADWYVAMERTTGARFRKDWPNYAELRRLALMSPPLPFDPHDEGISCFCGD